MAGRTLFLGGMAIPVGQDDNLARFTWSQLRGFQTGGARLLPRGQECDGHPATTSVPEGRRTIRGAGARSPAPAASNGGVGAPVFLAPPPATGGTTLSPDYRVPSGDIDLTPSTIRLRYRSTELVVDRAFYGDWADDHALLIRACANPGWTPDGSLRVGRVSSADDVMEALWGPVLQRLPPLWDDFFERNRSAPCDTRRAAPLGYAGSSVGVPRSPAAA